MFAFAVTTLVTTQVSQKFNPKPMTMCNGKYEKIGKLGHGGFGTVYEAKNRENGKIVAIKLLDDKKCGLKEVERELKAVSELRHPNIVESIDVGYDEKNRKVYIVMEKCDEDLASFLEKKGGHLKESEIKPIAGDIVEGLQYIHNQGMMHRDLKPANILMKGGKAKIADLGLVRESSSSQETATVAGTPIYMAPEVEVGIYNNKIDKVYMAPETPSCRYNKKVDIYSLGVITYELLGGRDHFKGIKENLLMPSGTSPVMKSLLDGMLKTDPIERMNINQVKTHAFFERHIQLD